MNFLISILDTPNNILAVEYLKALKRRNSAMTSILIPRAGSGYHDTTINTPTASASAIRAAVSNVTPSDDHTFHFSSADYGSQSIHSSRPHLSEIASSMPEPAFALFQRRSHPADLWMLMTFPPFLATGSYRAAKGIRKYL